jgi:PTH1 family peptidyl-tRNA hydrolase
MKSLLSFQNAARKNFIVVGLGNPGSAYEKTRHNVGFRAASIFAKRHSIPLKKKDRFSAEFGKRQVGEISVGVLLPMTYMNSSGFSVLKVLKDFKVPLDRVIVVVDDIAFPVGTVRLKEEGSHGGHNGLRSIEEHVGTKKFPRLRIGIGHPRGVDLADFVLSTFDKEDEKKMPQIFDHVADVLDCWILEGIQSAMLMANTKR